MATYADLILQSAEELGIVGVGQTLSANDQDYAFRRMLVLFDSMRAWRLAIPYPALRTAWTIVSGTRDYTLGSGGTINIERPSYISQIKYQDTSISPTQEYELGPIMTDAEWAAIVQKDLTASLPSAVYYNPTFGSSGLGTVSLWPTPINSTLQGVLYAPSMITTPTAVTQTIAMPPGYRDFYITQLALWLSPGFKTEPSPELRRRAALAKQMIQTLNTRQTDLQFDLGFLQSDDMYGAGYSILTGP